MKTTCLNDDQISGYLSNTMSRNEIRAVENHLSECHHCRQDVLMVSRLSRDPEINSWGSFWNKSIIQVIREKLVQMKTSFVHIFSHAPQQANFAFARIRNDDQQKADTTVFNKAGLNEQIQSERITIQIKEYDGHVFDIRVSLNKTRHHLSTFYLQRPTGKMDALCVQDDFVLFESLSPGSYQLILESQETEIETLSFDLNHEGLHEKNTISNS